MAQLLFRNKETDCIKELIQQEIGRERYLCACKDEGISQRPMDWKGFYIDFIPATGEYKLYHTYPSGVTLFIMDVLGYWRIPDKNWERIP